MTSSNGNIVRVTGALCGEFIDHRWIPLTKASDAELWFFFICAWINGWVNNREAGDLRRHRAHYDVIVMGVKLFAVTFILISQPMILSGAHIRIATYIHGSKITSKVSFYGCKAMDRF